MLRVAIAGFVLLSIFFYLTGRPLAPGDGAGFPIAASETRQAGQQEENLPALALENTNSDTDVTRWNQGIARLSDASRLQNQLELPVRNPLRRAEDASRWKLASGITALNRVPRTGPDLPQLKVSGLQIDGRTGISSQSASPSIMVPSASTSPSGNSEPANSAGPRLLAVLIKTELRRLGCFQGRISGDWENDVRDAVSLFNHFSQLQLDLGRPEPAVLDRLRGATAPFCPAGCTAKKINAGAAQCLPDNARLLTANASAKGNADANRNPTPALKNRQYTTGGGKTPRRPAAGALAARRINPASAAETYLPSIESVQARRIRLARQRRVENRRHTVQNWRRRKTKRDFIEKWSQSGSEN